MGKYVRLNYLHLCWLHWMLSKSPPRNGSSHRLLQHKVSLKWAKSNADEQKVYRMLLSDDDLRHIVAVLHWVAELPRKSITDPVIWGALLDLAGMIAEKAGTAVNFDKTSEIDGYVISL